MKKVLALILVLIMSVPSMLVFAETAESDILGYATKQIVANDSSAQYANDTVYTRYFNHSENPVFRLLSASVGFAPAETHWSQWKTQKTPVVYKIPLPVGSSSQVLDELYLHYSGTPVGSILIGTFTSVFKLSGEGWESKEGMSYNHADAKAAISGASTTTKAYDAFESTNVNSNVFGNTVRNKINISTYAKECIAAGQTYMYVGVIDEYTAYALGYESANPIDHPTISFKFKALENDKVTELKIVASSSDLDNAQNVTELAVGTAYRAVAKAYSYDSSSVDANMYVALYNANNELANVLVLPCQITSEASGTMIYSEEFVPEQGSTTVKAFLWDKNTLAPLIESKTSSVLQ